MCTLYNINKGRHVNVCSSSISRKAMALSQLKCAKKDAVSISR